MIIDYPRKFRDKECERNFEAAFEKVSNCTARGGEAESCDTRLDIINEKSKM